MIPGEEMNGTARTAGSRKQRKHATYAVAPITRAIRAALTVSTVALAITAPVAMATVPCSVVTASQCDGALRQAVADARFAPPVDLTVVAGEAPASVHPAPDAWTGESAAILSADTGIDTRDFIGALEIGVDDLTLADGGDAFTGDASGFHGAGMFSLGGDISIGDGRQNAIMPFAPTHAMLDDAGVLNADSLDDFAHGVASAVTSLAVIENGTDIHVSGYGNVVGLDLSDPDSVSLHNLADITVEALPDSYGMAIATGVRINSADAYALNDGSITATATADGGYARARTVDAFGSGVGATVHNNGDVQADAQADGGVARAFGVYSFGYATSSTVDNAGDIHASAQADGGRAYATAINSVAYGYSGGRDSSITNSGTLSADANADLAYAITVFNIATGRDGNAYVTNADEGNIYAEASGDFTTATGVINQATRYGSATTSNAGGIHATANGTSGAASFGISNYSQGYTATTDNSGSISATSTSPGIALATGVENDSALGNAYFYNSGSISANADSGTGMAAAWGVVDKSEQVSSITNDGDIDVVVSSQDGYALAVGAYALGGLATTLTNNGTISARSSSVNGDATAYAAVVNGGYAGIGLLINGGDLYAAASTAGGGDATATGAFVYADVATIFNDATTTAVASTVSGHASATGLGTYGGNSAIYNYGDVTATASASADGGIADAIGAENFGYTGASFYNAGDIAANASADGGVASATGASSVGIFTAYATNIGTISAAATGGQAIATGLYNASAFDAITYNEGSISAVAEGTLAAYGEYEAVAFGAYNLAVYYNSVIDNSGSISASASATTDISGTDGFLVAKALGAVALSMHGYGETVIANSGSITAAAETSQGYAGAWGAVISAGAYGSATLENEGSISAYAHTDTGSADTIGAYVSSIAGISTVVNFGDISAASHIDAGRGYAYATGVEAISVYSGSETTLSNHSTIEAHAKAYSGFAVSTGAHAYAYHASVTNAAGAGITATAYTDLFGSASALAVDAGGKYNVDVVNDGSISAYAHAAHGFHDPDTGNTHFGLAGAIGIYATAGTIFKPGDAKVVNNGDITATAVAEDGITFFNAGAGASGIRVLATYDAIVENAGNITTTANSDLGAVGAYGAVANGRHDSTIINHVGAVVIASGTVGSLGSDYYAGRAATMGLEVFGTQHGYVHNAGTVISHAVVTPDGGANPGHSIASAFGVEMRTHDTGLLVNIGDIHAEASADFGYASAYGARLPGNRVGDYSNANEATLDNAGIITASADADFGNAFAVGGYAYAQHAEYQGCGPAGCYYDVTGGVVNVDNRGELRAAATAHGGVGAAYGSVAIGAYAAATTNAGHISAVTDADDALAIGAIANSFYGDATLQNSGVIAASATGDIASASGVVVLGALGAQVDNAGTIVAGAYGADATATAVSMESDGSNKLTNTGTIGAFGDGMRIAISSSAGATASILNQGSITGAIITGDFDDSFENAAGATWLAVGDSDFGDGNNSFVNNGTILMDDATIALSGHADEAVSATFAAAIQPTSHISTTFENSGTLAVSGAGNLIDTGTLANNGVISFLDGAPDDMLTVVGDFSGDGVINLDVSGLNQASDQLYIDGSVIDTTTQTVNVNLLDVPNAPNVEIPLITVDGTHAGDFVLGDLQYTGNGFVSMDFGLTTADNVVSLGVEVTGLSDAGSLASVLAPGVQNLVDAQIGTWRQRLGVVPGRSGENGIAPWLRYFTSSGDVSPGHSANFGPGGNFGFHQSNNGWELGIEARPTDQVAVGVLFGGSEGSQRVDGAVGSGEFDGDTFGLYGTWMAGNGFYLDLSQRWTGIDARLETSTGVHHTEASAVSFNAEAGFAAWTIAGVNMVPQLQYTRTRVSDIDAMRVSGAEFIDDGGVSSRGRAGVAFDKTFQGAGFAWTPYGSINAVREFDGEYEHSINGGLLGTTSTDGTSAMVELGLGARKDQLSITGGVNWIDGGALESVAGGQMVVRYDW